MYVLYVRVGSIEYAYFSMWSLQCREHVYAHTGMYSKVDRLCVAVGGTSSQCRRALALMVRRVKAVVGIR